MPLLTDAFLKKQNELIQKSFSNELVREDWKELFKYFCSLKMQGQLNPEIEKILIKYQDLMENGGASNCSAFSMVMSGSNENSHDRGGKDAKLDNILRLDSGKIRSIFEQRYFLKTQRPVKFMGAKLIRYQLKNFCLAQFKAEVDFSMVVSRSGDLELFLIDCERQAGPTTESEDEAEKINSAEPSSFENVFFYNLSQALHIGSIREFFYNVFDLSLGNRLQYISGKFALYGNQIMYRVCLKGMVNFQILVDQKANLIDVFSINNKESLRKYIVSRIKLQDTKLNMNLMKDEG